MKRFANQPWRRVAAIVTALAVAVGVPAVALALTATTTSISASPSPVTAGQSVTLTATPSVPGIVTFTFDGQTIGTATTTVAAATTSGFTQWQYTGNSVAHRIATTPASTNIYVSTYNPTDCGGGRCQTKMLSPGGGVSYAPSESWNGLYVSVTGLAVASNGTIYEGIFNGSAQNTVRKRTSIGATSTEFVSSANICGTCASGSNYITGMTIDASDNIYVTNSREGKILKVTPAGAVSTYAAGLGSPIAGPVINRSTGVLYYIDGNQDIRQIPAGGGASTLLTAASCNIDANSGSPWFGNGGQLALDSSGFIYGAQCGGVTPTSTPNNSPITQINPATGAMREYMSWATCMSGSLPGWAASCGGNNALAFLGDAMYTASADMSTSAVMGMNPSGYVATFSYTPPTAGSFGFGGSLAPTNSGTYAGSSGSGTLLVRPDAPSAPDLVAASDLGSSSTDDRTSDNTPRIEVPGTYTSGDTITVTAVKSGSPNVTCTYVIPATGCDLGTLADGTWTVTATDTHPTGGASAASTSLSVIIDTAAPSAPTGVDLAAASDLGSSPSDNVTSDSTPTIGASGGAAGETMTITATKAGSPDVTCTYVLPASSCDLGTLADGTWAVSARLTDLAGNTSVASTPLNITIDTAGPGALTPDLVVGSDTGPSPTDDITSDSTPTITVPGQATGDVITITATKSGSPNVVCAYTVGGPTNCTLGTLADGTWNITASITDLAGNTGTTQSLPITIDTAAPSAPSGVDLASASDTGSSSTDNATRDNTPTISASGGQPGDTMTITAVKSGSPNVTCTYVLPATSCDLGTLADGTWAVSATLTDPAGNASTASSPLNISIDTTAPNAPSGVDLLASSDLGSSPTDNATSDNTPTIGASGGQPGDTMTITATKAGSPNVSCTYVLPASNCDLGTLADGAWAVSATLTDPAGNTSTASSPLNINIDTVGPTGPGAPSVMPASDTGASNSDGVTSDTTPEITVPGATNGDTITVTATNGGTTVTCTFVAASGVNSCTLPALGPGDWSVVASSNAVDAAGNPAAPSAPATISIDTANAAPGLPDLAPASDTGPSSSDDVTKDTAPVIDVPGVEPGSTVTVTARQAGRPDVTCTFTASASVTGCALPFLSDGTWAITASSVDPAGNQSPTSAPLSIFLDTAPPAPPATPTIPSAPASPSAPSGSSGSGAPALGPVQDLGGNTRPIVGVDGGTAGDVITVIAVNGSQRITCSFTVGQATRCQLPALPSGTWTITATATDTAGNVSSPSGSIKVRVTGKGGAVTALGKPVLRLTAVTTRHQLHPKDRAIVTLRARNVGKVTARNVVIRVTIPKGMAVVSQRSLALVHGRVSFAVGTLAAGKTASRQVTLVATSDGVGVTASVRAHLSATSATPRNVTLAHRIVAGAASGRGSGSGSGSGGAPVTG